MMKKVFKQFKSLVDASEIDLPNRYRSSLYREHDSDPICSKIDKEIMRIFPPSTDPNHILIFLEIFTRVNIIRQLDRSVRNIAEMNQALLNLRILGPSTDEMKIREKQHEIQKEEIMVWEKYSQMCEQRKSKTDFQVRMNTFNINQNLTKEFKRRMLSKSGTKQVHIFQDKELSFIQWYVSVFGDNWRLIESVLNYHPITYGYLRKKEQIQQQYFFYINSLLAKNFQIYNENSVIKPWRSCGLPLLINERPPSLYFALKQINQTHFICIKDLHTKRT